MATITQLCTRLNNSPAMRRGGNIWPMYGAWKAWALRQPGGPAYFAALQTFAREVSEGHHDVADKWPSIGRKRRWRGR